VPGVCELYLPVKRTLPSPPSIMQHARDNLNIPEIVTFILVRAQSTRSGPETLLIRRCGPMDDILSVHEFVRQRSNVRVSRRTVRWSLISSWNGMAVRDADRM